MAILQMARYHGYCGEKLGRRDVHVSAGDYDNPGYPVDFCAKCEAYMYYHGRNGSEGIESIDPHAVETYISKLILEGKKALVTAAP